ncbi:hypothetical protein VDP35_21860, partial [Xanthomonas campestris pv. campestris]|nr:hypothetical protein [Xanthomonas campestris pv. campestris]
MFTLINAADCDASTLTALSRGRKARTQRDSIELYAPAIANARPIITAAIVGARLRAMGRYREGPRAQARSYHSGFAWAAVFTLINAADCDAST